MELDALRHQIVEVEKKTERNTMELGNVVKKLETSDQRMNEYGARLHLVEKCQDRHEAVATEKFEGIGTTLGKMEHKLDKLLDGPADNWRTLVKAALVGVVSALVTAAMALLLIGP